MSTKVVEANNLANIALQTKLLQRRFRFFRWLSSPIIVMTLVWIIGLSIYKVASTLGVEFEYFHFMVNQENLIDTSTGTTFLWLLCAFIFFVAGASLLKIMVAPYSTAQPYNDIDDKLAFRALLQAFFFTSTVAFLWIGVAVIQFGGLGSLAALAASDNVMAREVILAASFPGGRLISSGFVGLAVFSATLLARRGGTLGNKRTTVVAIFIVSMVYLGIIPILVSGRVNFFIAVIGSFIAASYVQNRLIGFKYVLPGLAFLGIVWTAKQYFTLGHVVEGTSAVDQGYQGIIFYFYNDVLNVLNTIDKFEGYYTYGWYSTRFVFFFTFSDKAFLKAIAESREYIGRYVTAGEIPLLGAPIVDFGYFGFIYLFIIGFFCQYLYVRAAHKVLHVALYGMVCAALVLSVHASYITSQEVVYSLILVKFLAWRAKPYTIRRQISSL